MARVREGETRSPFVFSLARLLLCTPRLLESLKQKKGLSRSKYTAKLVISLPESGQGLRVGRIADQLQEPFPDAKGKWDFVLVIYVKV